MSNLSQPVLDPCLGSGHVSLFDVSGRVSGQNHSSNPAHEILWVKNYVTCSLVALVVSGRAGFFGWVRFRVRNHGPYQAHEILRVKNYGMYPPVALVGADRILGQKSRPMNYCGSKIIASTRLLDWSGRVELVFFRLVGSGCPCSGLVSLGQCCAACLVSYVLMRL